jgi:DivIVA domain-containing protein
LKLSPSDITHQEFNRSWRGFNADEVSAFLEVIAENYSEVTEENQAMALRLKQAAQELEQLRAQAQDNERMLRDQKNELLKMERLMDSKIDADFVLQKAESEADKIMAEAKKKADQIVAETGFLEQQKLKVAAYLREYLQSQLALLDIVQANESKIDPSVSEIRFPEISTPPANEERQTEEDARPETDVETSALEDSIKSFLKDIHLDDIPEGIAEEIKKDLALQVFGESETTDEKRKKVLGDLDRLITNATGMFKKSDFNKMLGEDATKKAEDMINQIYAELEKRKSRPNSSEME